MTARKQVTIKSHLTPDDKRELLEAINKAWEVSEDVLECGSALASLCHESNGNLRKIAIKLGYKQENWYSKFTL